MFQLNQVEFSCKCYQTNRNLQLEMVEPKALEDIKDSIELDITLQRAREIETEKSIKDLYTYLKK